MSEDKKLLSLIERIENIAEEKRNASSDMAQVYAEAKEAGYDVRVVRQIVKLRKMDEQELDTYESLLETYKQSLGMSTLPLPFEDRKAADAQKKAA